MTSSKRPPDSSCSRVILAVHVAEVLELDVRLDLRGRDVGVAEQLLHRGQIRAALQQMRRERMPQCMRRHALAHARAAHVLAQDLPYSHARERASLRVEEHGASRGTARKAGADL